MLYSPHYHSSGAESAAIYALYSMFLAISAFWWGSSSATGGLVAPVADVATDAAADTGAAGGAIAVVLVGGRLNGMVMAMGAAAAGVTAVGRVVSCNGNKPVAVATTVPAGCCSAMLLPVVVLVEMDAAAERDARSIAGVPVAFCRAVALGMAEGGCETPGTVAPFLRLLGWAIVPSGAGAGMPRGTSCGLPAGERRFWAPLFTPVCCN